MSVSPTLMRTAWLTVLLLWPVALLNYLDRQTLSVLAATIQKDLGLTDVDYSHITSAFLMTYTVMYAVGGRLIDLMGTRRGLMVFVTGWSIADMLNALARSASQLTVFRFLLGVTEAYFQGYVHVRDSVNYLPFGLVVLALLYQGFQGSRRLARAA